jgi:hypothetical protein
MFIHSAFIAAIFYFVPNLFPFFAPAKWTVAGNADLLRQQCFCFIFQMICV